jgi:cysteine desulfurase
VARRFLAWGRGQKASVSKGVRRSRGFGIHKALRYKSAAPRLDAMTDRAYLDWNATAPLRPEAREAMCGALDVAGNPSSVHAEGRAARRLVEAARERVAALVGAEPRNVVFTSGGTEANVLALSPAAGAGNEPCGRLMVSAIEHPSVLAGGRFSAAAVERLPVTGRGEIDLSALATRLKAAEGRVLVSLMLANNETGIVQPVSEAAHLVHQAGGMLHVDAVQAAGRIACDINALSADLLTVSGHKIGRRRSDPARRGAIHH